ncbi:hypothetical protein DL96DRAFT_1462413 [Flagelloscypha sp. PMI_526]|nr:hypothetical protein DL96DRAFT_1462413 [Flagelloscypha sp. PMI_526]
MKIAVLGGGITGLSATFHLARRFPHSEITLFEKKARTGGWIQSTRVPLRLGGSEEHVVLESGPRTLRPKTSKAVFELIHLLNLSDQLLLTSSRSPAARRRFIYVPPEYQETTNVSGLIQLPGLQSPAFRNQLIWSVLKEPFKSTRQFRMYVGSALVHGVYAADSREVSTRSAFTSLWDMAVSGKGSLSRGLVRRTFQSFLQSQMAFRSAASEVQYEVGDVERLMVNENTSVYSFKDGMETLPLAMKAWLENQPNVQIVSDSTINSVKTREEDRTFEISPTTATHMVSALPAPALQQILSPTSLPGLLSSPLISEALPSFSTVTVLNLVFAISPNSPPLHPDGFGFLVPRPPEHSPEGNPLGILGVVFDSCSLSGQDSAPSRLLKMTVMLGGPYANGHDVDASKILAFISRATGSHLPDPVHVQWATHQNCIPHPRVGHEDLLTKLWDQEHREWVRQNFAIVGPGFTGVSVGDCVNAGREVSEQWIRTMV